jgi:hypothetical protein
MGDFEFDIKEIIIRLVKYLFEGIVVAFAAYMIPGKKMDVAEVVVIGVIAAATFSILDLFAPALSGGVRSGAAFGVGANLVGFPGGAPDTQGWSKMF